MVDWCCGRWVGALVRPLFFFIIGAREGGAVSSEQ